MNNYEARKVKQAMKGMQSECFRNSKCDILVEVNLKVRINWISDLALTGH
jgi:hypothetical protein